MPSQADQGARGADALVQDEGLRTPPAPSPLTGSFSGKVIRNTIFNTIGNCWMMAIRFFMTPYVLYHLKDERYGVWAVVGVLTGFIGLLDFGLARSFDKYLAEYYTKRDHDSFNMVVSIGLTFYLLFSALIIALAVFARDPLMKLIGLSPDRLSPAVFEESAFVFVWAVVIFGWSTTSSVFGMIMTGLQRMDVINKIGIVTSLLGVIGTVIALELGYGLKGLVVCTGVIAVIGTGITLAAAYWLFPDLRINPLMAHWPMFRRMFSFGLKLQVAKLANLFTFQLDRPLISRFLHVSYVTPYNLGAGFIWNVRQVLLMIPSAVIPATSELEASNRKERSYEFYERGTRYLVLISTPVCTFSAVAAALIIGAWLGPGYEQGEEATRVIQILALGYYANLSTGVATGVAVGMGKPEYEMQFGILLAVLSLVFSLSLITTVGFYGPAFAATGALTICALYFYTLFHRYLNRPLGPFLRRNYGTPILASLIAALITGGLNFALLQVIEPTNRWLALMLLGIEGVVFVSVYVAIMVKTHYLDAYDRMLFQRYLARPGIG